MAAWMSGNAATGPSQVAINSATVTGTAFKAHHIQPWRDRCTALQLFKLPRLHGARP
ncbi:hypothetical protein GCM10010464_10050 [Pseudonocardia yunnanensis]